MIRAKHPIRHNGKQFLKGAIIEGLTAAEANRLVTLKSAEYILSPEEELAKQKAAGQSVTITSEQFEELRAALDDEYNAEELTRAAKDVGVDLTGVKGKAATIEAIIHQGKADELLEDDDQTNE